MTTNNLREKTVLQITEIVKEYCKTAEPTNVYLAFKKEVDKPLMIETKYPIPNENITVMISDIRKDWQLPLAGTKDIGNPKLKEMSREDFEKTFDILSYTVQEESQIIMKVIDKLGLHKWEHEGKLKQFHYYQGSYNK